MAGQSSKLKCLICAIQLSNLAKSNEKLLAKHLEIVFILRKVLNISSDKLVKVLKDFPNVEEWISVCDKCETLVNQCKELYLEVLKATRKFEKGRERVIKIVKESCLSSCNDDNDDDKDQERLLDVFKEVRRDVSEFNCNPDNYPPDDNLKGDELAEKLIAQQSQLNDKPVIKTEQEEDDDSAVQEDPDFELLSDKCTSDDDDDNHEVKPEVGDLVLKSKRKTKTSGFNSDKTNYKTNSKEEKPYIIANPSFECPFCKKFSLHKINSPLTVINHLKSCQLEYPKLKEITCPNCNKFNCSSSNIIPFYHHSISCLSSKRVPLYFWVFQCDLCPPSAKTPEFFTLFKFLTHLSHHKEFIYKCTQCSSPLKNSLDSEKHWKKHHPLEYQAIPEGQRSSSCHISIPPALPSVPWWCPHCSQEFSTDDLRNHHVSSSHHHPTSDSSKDYLCQLCDKRYYCTKELQLHQLISHSIISFDTRKRFYKCSLCPEVFSGLKGKEDLLTHQSRVHKICQFKCSTCSKEFSCESTLRNHQTSHKLNLKCVPCGKTYSSKAKYDIHVAVVHEKSISFTCDICGKCWADNWGLKKHQRDKHGLSESKWRCKVEGCGKILQNSPCFKAHMDRHAKCPEFKCSKCGKEFYESRNLLRHEKTVHSTNSDEDFVCDECPFRTKFKCNLKTHKETAHHPSKPVDKVYRPWSKSRRRRQLARLNKKPCK